MSNLVERLRYAQEHGIYRAIMVDMGVAYGEAADRIEKLEKALREIACYSDYRCVEFLAKAGRYTSFDEPVSARIARKALEE